MKITVYDSTGKILCCTHATESELSLYEHWIPGEYSNDQYQIQAGAPVRLPARPTDDRIMRFDHAAQTWQTDILLTSSKYRKKRNDLLEVIDRVNPVWYAALTAEQQAELAAYRQALLAVPQQAGFPDTVDWPQQPSWL